MIKTQIKPLSVNEAWRGKRKKTIKYLKYQRDLTLLLPNNIKIPDGNISLKIVWGLSNMGGDVDNPLKAFIDTLQIKYGFNDSRIMKIEAEKEKVGKGEEFIKWEVKKIYGRDKKD